MRNLTLATIAFSLGIGVPAKIGAQTPNSPLGLQVRGGIFFPGSSAASALGDQWFVAGAEFNLFKIRVPGANVHVASITASVDGYNKSSATSVPILLNFFAVVDRMHFGAGAGVAFTKRPFFNDATRFAYGLSAGYDLFRSPTPVSVDLRWYGVTGAKGFFDGLAVTLGIRL